ncbi:type II toxin-antitoxin system VapB family antitoxin [Aurantimonas sp. A2-1-M11]|uniref:type II toxin-antitoxin system VapB family antitoxin n=1 Tax=Aurantimonas sp. A2-1-M11 TaxID=3113712 RepID=UPI002F9274BE
MPLFVKDPEVGELADRLASLKGVTKTEAVRQALRHEITARPTVPDATSPYVRGTLSVVDDFHERYGPPTGNADKAWIDSLYEDG